MIILFFLYYILTMKRLLQFRCIAKNNRTAKYCYHSPISSMSYFTQIHIEITRIGNSVCWVLQRGCLSLCVGGYYPIIILVLLISTILKEDIDLCCQFACDMKKIRIITSKKLRIFLNFKRNNSVDPLMEPCLLGRVYISYYFSQAFNKDGLQHYILFITLHLCVLQLSGCDFPDAT